MLDFEELDLSGPFDRDRMREMRDRQRTGVILRGFLNEVELGSVISALNTTVAVESVTTNLTFPASFSNDMRLEAYADAERRERFLALFKDNLDAKLKKLFSLLGQGRTAEVPEVDGVAYLPGTFRIIHPGHCHIDLHCGNQFFHQFREVYGNLTQLVDVSDQLSFFIMLQRPERGGELEVYDALWDEYPTCNLVRQTLVRPDGSEIAITSDELIKYRPALQPGDLLVFQGGQYWHKVLQVEGTRHRITYGGFIGVSKTDDGLYYWS